MSKDLLDFEFNPFNGEFINSKEKNENMIYSFINDIGYFFIEKNGKDIPLETIIEAASIVNSRVFGFNEEQTKEYKEFLYNSNLERDKESFPYYYENGRIL